MNARFHLPLPSIDRTISAARGLRRALIGVAGFSAFNAIGGGIGLLVNGLGVPPEQLDGTPFSSLTVPGLLLAGVVGGSMLAATIAAWRKDPRAGSMTMGAGAVMFGWIVIESYMIRDGRPLQATVALLSILSIALGYAMERQANSR